MSKQTLTLVELGDILGVSNRTIRARISNGSLVPIDPESAMPSFLLDEMKDMPGLEHMFASNWEDELHTHPKQKYKSIEIFAGAGGLAIGMEKAGFENVLLNEIDRHACDTLELNKPSWNVARGDISSISFKDYHNQVDVLTGGFPCQAFSYAGNKMGFNDTRGTLFFEYARAVKEINPKIMVAENVKGLLNHDDGKTLRVIKGVIDELGYELVEPKVLKAIFYQVPQKRERLILVAIRKDLQETIRFEYPARCPKMYTVKDALKAGVLFDEDCPESKGTTYPQRKKEIMTGIPQGGYWKDLPMKLQKEYMKKSFYLGGGKTGMARRLSWDSPSLTLTCSPAQKQTERCHPEETRPLTVREYARIQTFPDSWEFSGPITAQYKQIGNAVPVNLSHAVARSLVRALNLEYD